MASDELDESDPLEQLLDQESQDQFGLPLFREHLDGEESPLVLKNWTAQDFSDIYVRFHPHLLRHAKRYLTNHSQAEEVVQDAFLYLMTSLPEIDSETGALRLLKWKVRLLALDVISSNGKVSFAPIDDQFDLEAVDTPTDSNLLRADEAAIVSLALAKLQPRQREALIASIYEDKRVAQVGIQLGVSENAAKQLIHRAKAAFRVALIGEAETRGLSVSQILSIAARKASQDAGKKIAVTTALLLGLAVSIGVINLPSAGPDLNVVSMPNTQGETSQTPPEVSASPVPQASVVVPEEVASTEVPSIGDTVVAAGDDTSSAAQTVVAAPAVSIEPIQEAPLEEVSTLGIQLALGGERNAGFAIPGQVGGNVDSRQLLIFTQSGESLLLDLRSSGDGASPAVSNLEFKITTPMGQQLIAIGQFASAVAADGEGYTISIVATDFSVPAESRDSADSLENLTLTAVIQLDRLGQPIDTSIFIH